MKLVKRNLKELGVVKMKKSEILELLEEFAESDMDCAEITNFRHANANSCANSFDQAITRYKMTGIRAIQKSGRVYLVKADKI